jgi:tol-pal system protein YbgF
MMLTTPEAASPRPLKGAPPVAWQSQFHGGRLGRLVSAAVLLAASVTAAQAQLFPDNEARKAILELRASDEKFKQDLAAQNKELSEQLAQIKRSLLDLSSQLDQVRGELAKQRGANEQLARDVAELQRRQKDIAQGVDERMRKIEPQRVTLDGKVFLADAEEKRLFDESMAIVRAGDFPGAASALTDFLRRYPQSGYGDSARFWLGNALYGKRDLREAITMFRTFISNSPEHARVPEAMLAIANSQAESKDSKSARLTLGELLRKYPQSEAAQAGKERLAALK